MLNGSNITASSTNGMVGNYAQSYISQIFSAPTNIIGGTMQTSNSSGIRGLGAGVSTLGSQVGGSIGRGVYESVLENGLSKESVGSGITSGFKNAFNFSDGKFGKLSSTGVGLGMNAAGTILAAIGGPKREYSGEKGDITQGLDTAYDIAQTAVGFIPGVGTMVWIYDQTYDMKENYYIDPETMDLHVERIPMNYDKIDVHFTSGF